MHPIIKSAQSEACKTKLWSTGKVQLHVNGRRGHSIALNYDCAGLQRPVKFFAAEHILDQYDTRFQTVVQNTFMSRGIVYLEVNADIYLTINRDKSILQTSNTPHQVSLAK